MLAASVAGSGFGRWRGDNMRGTGRTRRRAVMTMVAEAAVGLLLLVGAAGGGAPTAPAGTAQSPLARCTDAVGSGPGVPERTALLIGDSQSAGAAGVPAERTWPQAGLREAGYDVRYVGAGGTGFVAANGFGATNYPTALSRGQWALPCTDPALIVVQGGGNDATQGASDAQITRGAGSVVSTLARTYPSSRIVLIGTLARDAAHGGGRRTAVDGVLGAYAAHHRVPFIGVGDWLTRYRADALLADAVHLTQAGHDRLAGVLKARLRDLRLAQPDVARTPPTADPGQG
ncbi:SGNH/GDSL hydrolase family protein [Arthrobacter pityocampae]|nr:SGNH/GDSL hydrolase family protein [Arthrobacter pityocampae]